MSERSRGKGSELRDWKGLGWCGSEEEKRAEKCKGQKSEDGPMRGEFIDFSKFWGEGPMGRGEYVGVGGVRGDDARDEQGKL